MAHAPFPENLHSAQQYSLLWHLCLNWFKYDDAGPLLVLNLKLTWKHHHATTWQKNKFVLSRHFHCGKDSTKRELREMKMEKLSNLKKIASFIFTVDSLQTRATEENKISNATSSSQNKATSTTTIFIHIRSLVWSSPSPRSDLVFYSHHPLYRGNVFTINVPIVRDFISGMPIWLFSLSEALHDTRF